MSTACNVSAQVMEAMCSTNDGEVADAPTLSTISDLAENPSVHDSETFDCRDTITALVNECKIDDDDDDDNTYRVDMSDQQLNESRTVTPDRIANADASSVAHDVTTTTSKIDQPQAADDGAAATAHHELRGGKTYAYRASPNI